MKHRLLVVVLVGLFLTGCASSGNEQNDQRSDPLEGFNRAMFNVNYNYLDPYFLRPVAVTWNNYVPKPVRSGISNFSGNLEEPFTMINYLIQGEPSRAMAHFTRFFINTFFGIGGLIDVASLSGDPVLRKEDYLHFGSTLGSYGVGYGPYVVLPGYGSLTPRQDGGQVVDSLYPPLYWLVGWPMVGKWMLDGIESRARLLDQDQILKDSADPYLFIRESYFQYEDFLTNGGEMNSHKNPNAQVIQGDLDEIDSY